MNAFSRARLGRIMLALAVVGCGDPSMDQPDTGTAFDSGSPVSDAGSDGGADAATMPDSGPPPDAGPPTCDTLDCDDGVACTEDRCSDSTCMHVVRHELCGADSYCDATMGCVGGEACATDDDCPPSPGGCFGPPRCIPDSRTCSYPVLDGDMDGYGPPVCGGMDCNDADPAVHPGAPEDCDGADDDCNGTPDSPLAARACRDDQVCAAGACGCPAGEEACYGVCRDTMNDPRNCGGCGIWCATNESCVGGMCTCGSPYTDCGASWSRVCVDRNTDVNNCGVCGYRCILGATCTGGTCGCPAGQTACPLGCVELGTNDNCTSCGEACGAGATCTPTGCSPSFPWLVAYGSHVNDSISGINQAIDVAPDGSVIHVGNYGNALYDAIAGGSTPVFTAGNIMLSKHDSSGVRQWIHRWARSGGTSSSGYSVVDVAVGDDGAIYVLLGGNYNLVLDGTTTITGTSQRQTLVVGLDATGAYRWHRFSTGAAAAYALDVTGTEVTVLGEAVSTAVDFGGGALPGTGMPGFVAVLDGATGAHLYSFRLPVSPHFMARRGSSLWLGGAFTGTVTLGGTALTGVAGSWDIFVAEVTTAGAVTSAFRFGTAGNDAVYGIGVLSDGDLIMSINTASIIRLTASGEVVWFEPYTMSFDTIEIDGSDRIVAAHRAGGTLTLRRFAADGTSQLDVPIGATSLDVAVRGSTMAIGGAWEPSIDVGGHHVRTTVSGSSGIWLSKVEAP